MAKVQVVTLPANFLITNYATVLGAFITKCCYSQLCTNIAKISSSTSHSFPWY